MVEDKIYVLKVVETIYCKDLYKPNFKINIKDRKKVNIKKIDLNPKIIDYQNDYCIIHSYQVVLTYKIFIVEEKI